jgi:hypothetical protein
MLILSGHGYGDGDFKNRDNRRIGVVPASRAHDPLITNEVLVTID